jgi:hypothetical protein
MSFVSSLSSPALSLSVLRREVPGYDAGSDTKDDDEKGDANAHDPATACFFVLFL